MPIAAVLIAFKLIALTHSHHLRHLQRPLLLSFLLMLLSQPVTAHFKLNLNIRILHIDHQSDGLMVYLRVPMPYLVASHLGPEQSDGSREPAPYTTNADINGELMHYVDATALQKDARGLGQLAADGHTFSADDGQLVPSVVNVLVHTGDDQPPFSTLSEAQSALKGLQSQFQTVPFVGDSVVDVQIHYPLQRSISTFEISSKLDPKLPGQENTANLILDYGSKEPLVYRITGLMHEPVTIDRSAWKAARTFVVEGVKHILGGYDHLLFVVCLVLGAMTLASLAWRITGFTIGHSITLSLGFFGFVPTSTWFVLLVEIGIALSIIYAAVYALRKASGKQPGLMGTLWMTALVGMLHGLGFSFVLQEILGVSAPNIWVSLLSFNVGVEIGQLAIVLLCWPILFAIAKFLPAWLERTRWLIALPCIGLASLWVGQRTVALVANIL